MPSLSDRSNAVMDRLAPAAAVIMVIPAWVAALRVGFGHRIPVGDTAIMALRAPDVLSRHLPLIGMPASSASSAEHVVHFPGALQLYWLAAPVKLLGATWGTVVAMGALNTIWILLAAWLIRRNLSTAATLCTYAVLSVFLWSLGSGMLIDSWPLLMVVVPFALVVIAAWFTACGDLRALVVLAVATNYVWLDHLVLGVLAPIVALTGCVGLLVWYRRTRRTDPVRVPEVRRGLWRHIGAAGGATVIMWLPSLIQQFTNSPGNLGQVFSRTGDAQPAVASWTDALHVVASLTSAPPFWFRGTLTDPTFYRAHLTGFVAGGATWFDLIAAVLWFGAFIGLGFTAWHRSDRVGLWLLIVAAATLVGSALTVYLAPATTALVPEYLLSLWVTAVFTWLAVGLNLARTLRIGSSARGTWAGFAVVVIFSVLNLPTSHTGYTAHPVDTAVSRDMIGTVIPKLAGQGPVGIRLENPLGDNANPLSALLVALDDHGIAFCYPTPNTSLYTFIPDCDGSERAVIVLAERHGDAPPRGDVLFREAMAPVDATARVEVSDRRVRGWLEQRRELVLTHAAQRPFLGPMIPQILRSRVDSFDPRDGNLGYLADSEAFWNTIITWYERGDNRDEPLFEDQPIGNTELYDWARSRRQHAATLWVVRGPASRGAAR